MEREKNRKVTIGQFTCFTLGMLVILTEGTSVKVHPGGNVTLPCTVKDDQEISWIITKGNQTFVRILRVEYGDGEDAKPNHYNMNPDYEGRIRAVSSLTNTHSLFLMNITSTDLMLYCCMNFNLEQTYCTKLDFEDTQHTVEGVEQQDTEDINRDLVMTSLWFPVFCVLLSLLLMSNICVYWKVRALNKGCVRNDKTHLVRIHNIVEDKIKSNESRKKQEDWTLAEVIYA